MKHLGVHGEAKPSIGNIACSFRFLMPFLGAISSALRLGCAVIFLRGCICHFTKACAGGPEGIFEARLASSSQDAGGEKEDNQSWGFP